MPRRFGPSSDTGSGKMQQGSRKMHRGSRKIKNTMEKYKHKASQSQGVIKWSFGLHERVGWWVGGRRFGMVGWRF